MDLESKYSQIESIKEAVSRIDKIRVELGITQVDLAYQMGMEIRSFYRHKKAGYVKLSVEQVLIIYNYFAICEEKNNPRITNHRSNVSTVKIRHLKAL